MAVARIKKIHIFGLNSQREELLSYLQEISCVQIIKTTYTQMPAALPLGRPAVLPDTKETLKEFDLQLSQLKGTIDLLDNLQRKESFIESIFKTKHQIKKKDLTSLVDSYDYKETVKKINSLQDELMNLRLTKVKLYDEYHQLFNWRNLRLPIEELIPTKKTDNIIGKLTKRNLNTFVKELDKTKIPHHREIIFEDKKETFLVLVYLKEDIEKLESALKKISFQSAQIPIQKGTVSERLTQIKTEINQTDDSIKKTAKDLYSYLNEKIDLEIIYDYLYNIRKRLAIQENFANTQKALIIEGWINSKETKKITEDLETRFHQVACVIAEPKPGEDVPVLLENMPPFRPFEVVTKLYGQPRYLGIDPTSFLAPFFALSFALCLTDAGYGLVLALISIFILKRFRLGVEAKKFFKLFLLTGIFTVFAGASVGSWFGNILDKAASLKKIKEAIMIFDPIAQPLKFLALALGVGFIQIAFGVFLNFLKRIKEKEYFTAFFSQLPTLAIQIDLLLLVLGFSGFVSKALLPYLWWIFSIASFLLVFYHWRTNKDLGLKLFWCIFGIYSVITGNFLADTLSFSRLFALGLTTGLLATAINEIVFLIPSILGVLKIPLFVGVAVSIFIFVFGHIANLAINLLGAYVHTSRLQYLEFFTKFFEPGGKPFNPFRKEYIYSEIID